MKLVEDLMTSTNPSCSLEKTIEDIAAILDSKKCSEIIILNSDAEKKPIGVISEHDIISACSVGEKMFKRNTRDFMQKLPVIIDCTMDIEDCYRIMEYNKIQSAPVIDREGRYCGQISLDDLVLEFKD